MLFLEITLTITILIIGVLGSFLPIIPGPIITFLGFLFLHFCTRFQLENPTLSIFLVLVFVILISLSDYLLQIIGVKKMGGGKNAIWGVTIGAFLGLIFSTTIIAILLGPFLGGILGSLLDFKLKVEKSETKKIHFLKSLYISAGGVLGFFLGVCLKVLFSLIILLISIMHILKYFNF